MRAKLRTVRNIARAVRRGETFPAAGRVPAADAPGGSTRSLLLEGRGEMAQLELGTHRVPLAGLEAPLRVVQVSDVHLREDGPWVDTTLRWVAAAVADAAPDVLVLTGDVVTRGWERRAAERFLGGLPRARLGTLAVMGNWEHWGGAPPPVWEPLCSAHGVQLLRDEAVTLGGAHFVGTEDMLAGPADLERAFAGVGADGAAVVLSHSPAIFPAVAARAPNPTGTLVLSGHTHGGQVRIPLLGPFFLPRGSGAYPWGWYHHRGAHLHVNRGLGWSISAVRWGARPEISTHLLVPGK